ncbi:hypothetical protein [Arthrobacter sp. H5]|uniref:hypothetical protein n=1 Tax=Arthrobacter sp. H5 TaxID=1267973 RepID=UPI0004B776B2|nr:hypothetical protein [Arthrobacter sp. H5]
MGITVIAVILLLESVALFAAAGWYLTGLLTSTPASLGGAVFMLVLLVLFAGWLLVVSHFVFRGFRWTRSAALVFQLFVIVLAVPTLTAGVVWAGLLMIVPAALVLHQLFTKAVMAFMIRTTDTSRAL